MASSLIYTVNNSAQSVDANGIINPGTVIRRFGCNLALAGNAIQASGRGYYDLLANVVVSPAATGDITATLLKDGVAIPGATATGSVSAIGDFVSLAVPAVIRETCCGDNTSAITCVLSAAGTVTNFTIKGTKE